MKTIEIKKVALEGLDQLCEIAIQTFSETYASHNSREDMEKYLDERFSPAKQGHRLAYSLYLLT